MVPGIFSDQTPSAYHSGEFTEAQILRLYPRHLETETLIYLSSLYLEALWMTWMPAGLWKLLSYNVKLNQSGTVIYNTKDLEFTSMFY